MTERISTADAVRDAVIRRPTGEAASARAASAFQGYDDAALTTPASLVFGAMRTTLQLHPAMRTALKRRALDLDTTMGGLIRAAVNVGLENPPELARKSAIHRRSSGGVRTTLDLPRDMHRSLKMVAADEETSLQALVVAAILQAYPGFS